MAIFPALFLLSPFLPSVFAAYSIPFAAALATFSVY